VSHTCGVIAIGPFGCMPNRLSEAILNEAMNRDGKLATDPSNERLRSTLTHVDDLPFLAIESDGSPFPQVINAKLEAFCLQARRLHDRMLEAGNKGRWTSVEVNKIDCLGADISRCFGVKNPCATRLASSEKT